MSYHALHKLLTQLVRPPEKFTSCHGAQSGDNVGPDMGGLVAPSPSGSLEMLVPAEARAQGFSVQSVHHAQRRTTTTSTGSGRRL